MAGSRGTNILARRYGRLHTASQQLPELGDPPRAVHAVALGLTLQRVLGGQSCAPEHEVTPSWQRLPSHDPRRAEQQMTEPPGFPQVDRAAQPLTAPTQFLGRPYPTATAAAPATHLTYCPWVRLPAQLQRP